MNAQLIIIHGWAMNKAIWHQLEQSLKDDIHIVSIDLPGYGKTDYRKSDDNFFKSADNYTLENIATQIAPVLNNAQQNIVLGWSLGGLVAIELARLFPHKILQVILVATNPKFIRCDDWPYAVEKKVFINFADQLKHNIKKTIKRFIAIQAMGSHTVKEDIKTIQQLLETNHYADYHTLSQGLEILLSSDMRETLLSLQLPVLMIAGDRDTLVKIAGLQQLDKKGKNLSLSIITGAGHAPFISHFQQFDHILRKAMSIPSHQLKCLRSS